MECENKTLDYYVESKTTDIIRECMVKALENIQAHGAKVMQNPYAVLNIEFTKEEHAILNKFSKDAYKEIKRKGFLNET